MANSLAPLALPDGTLNPAAFLQAAALLNCLQNNDRTGAQQLLAQSGPAQIAVWTWFPETLPPDLSVIVDGDSIYIVIIGTMNPSQWTGQIAGATATPYPPQPGVSAGAFWLPIATQLATEISQLAFPGITRMVIVGHSYGAAVGQLVALNFAANPGQLTEVSALLIGSPVPLTAGYTGPLPSPMFRVNLPGDIVPQLPPAGFNASIPFTAPLNSVTGYGPQWSYYGTGYSVALSGGLTADQAAQPTLSAALAALAEGNLSIHEIQNYTAAAIATYQLTAGDPATSRWLAGAAAQAALPSPQVPPPPIDQNSWVNVPGANTVYLGQGQSLITGSNLGTIQSVALRIGSATVQSSANIHDPLSGGLMATFSGFAKCTLILNNDIYGRFISATVSNVTSLADAFIKAKRLATYVAACMGNSLSTYAVPLPALPYPEGRGTPCIDYVRLSDALNPRVAKPENLGGTNYAGFLSGKPADFQSTALSMRLPGASIQLVGAPPAAQTFQHFGNFLLVGQPDDCVQAGVYIPGLVLIAGKTMDGQLSVLLNYLSNSADSWGFMGLDYTQPLRPTGTWTIFNVNFWQFTIENHGWTEGDRVRITAANSIGFNGVYKIHKIDANTISLTNGPRTALPAPTQADARRVQLADGTRLRQFYRYQVPPGGWNSPFGIKVSKKNPGRRFTGVTFSKRRRRPR